MYRPEKAKEIFEKYKMLDREDSAEIIEALNAIDEPEADLTAALAENDRKWNERFTKQFLTGSIENPGLGAPEAPLPETAPDPIIEDPQLTYDNLFEDIKE